ncbi:hypothetical protein [Pseudomonas atacamensis]|uniref:hypothetical protein n=1 Tax=Pseudomonas atacamensis TaxID=2565368 RepID=UPI003CE83FBC
MYYYAYSEDGLGVRIVLDGWDLNEGETIFDHELSEDEKIQNLPGYVPLAWREVQAKARTELVLSDMTAIRCFKDGRAFPDEWARYVKALRLIVRTHSGDPDQSFPEKPDYPEEEA